MLVNAQKITEIQQDIFKLDEDFLSSLPVCLAELILCARKNHEKNYSILLLELAPYLEGFLAKLFGVEANVDAEKQKAYDFAIVQLIKRQFVQRRATLKFRQEAGFITSKNFASELKEKLKSLDDVTFAKAINEWLEDGNGEWLEKAESYAIWATLSSEGKAANKHSQLFQIPQKVDVQNLLTEATHKSNKWFDEGYNDRINFKHSDTKISDDIAYSEAHYCIYCHKQNKDSCRTGLKNKSSEFKSDAFGQNLNGCPLEQKVSEMNLCKTRGLNIAALAIICIDNPLVAATGSRICNDCMKACIFQKQDAVDIPKVETQILKTVLDMPWGVEIYYLLTQWNPLNFKNQLPKVDQNKSVLVVGMGPAGFSLAYYLLHAGYHVTGIDGLKIEAFDNKLLEPIQKFSDICEDLDDRQIAGFGGVMEYGITIRWDKNFLKLIRLILERNAKFSHHGGIRFGSTITTAQALDTGFSAIGLCIGTGSPTMPNIPNALATGVRTSNDFLMNLQLLGAFQNKNKINLQLRAPIVVIGAGLTAIDTATEARSYYLKQIIDFEKSYQKLCEIYGKDTVTKKWKKKDFEVAEEFLNAAKDYSKNKKLPREIVKVIYRKKLQEAPAYRINHEEVTHALKEGIIIQENTSPIKVNTDNNGAVFSITVNECGKIYDIPTKSILMATGIKPNISITYDENIWKIDEKTHALTLYKNGQKFVPKKYGKENKVTFNGDEKGNIFIFGDANPSFNGSVVKAIASAKIGVKEIIKSMQVKPGKVCYLKIDQPTIELCEKLDEHTYKVIVKSKQHALNFKAGQFYRLQQSDGIYNNESVPTTAFDVDKNKGLISFLLHKIGTGSAAITNLKPGDSINIMGPTGQGVEIPQNAHVALIGSSYGHVFLMSLLNEFKKQNCEITYFLDDLNSDYLEESVTKYNISIVQLTDETLIEKLHKCDHHFVSGPAYFVEKIRDLYLEKLPISHLLTPLSAPMQCMMKGVCGQCMQEIRDPKTGKLKRIYTCAEHIQNVENLNFKNVSLRMRNNHLLEKIATFNTRL